MALITKIPGVTFTDATLPKLYRDAIITTGTKFVVDAGDLYSFAKQATPTTGEAWKDLTPNSANATFNGTATFSNGGFSLGGGNGNSIELPASGKVSASAVGLMFGIWVKQLGASANAYSGMAGMADATGPSVNQYSVDAGAANSGAIRLTVMGSTAHSFVPAINSVHQLVMGCKRIGSNYEAYFWRNGVLVATTSLGAVSIGQPTAQLVPRVGVVNGFSEGANFRTFRTYFDDTSALLDVAAMTALVLKDYNANVSRFS